MSDDKAVDDRDLLVAVGEAIWGKKWRRPLGLAAGISHPTLTSIEHRERPMTGDLRARLGRWASQALLAEREVAQRRLALLSQAQDRWNPMESKTRE